LVELPSSFIDAFSTGVHVQPVEPSLLDDCFPSSILAEGTHRFDAFPYCPCSTGLLDVSAAKSPNVEQARP
jgi:hypothetical protein